MMLTPSDCPPAVCLIADHLDLALAAGEDLLASSLRARADLDETEPETAPEALDRFVKEVRRREQSLLLHVLQARNRLADIGRSDTAIRMAANLFRAETGLLAEMVSDDPARIAARLDNPEESYGFLRSRGLLAPEAAAPSPFERVDVTERMRIGGRIELGPLLDLAASLLDLLDARFGLYQADLDAGASRHADVIQAEDPAEPDQSMAPPDDAAADTGNRHAPAADATEPTGANSDATAAEAPAQGTAGEAGQGEAEPPGQTAARGDASAEAAGQDTRPTTAEPDTGDDVADPGHPVAGPAEASRPAHRSLVAALDAAKGPA